MSNGQIKERMDKLDTLGGGIVYGREEAWDKLQARMDRPALKVWPPYMLAAAAAVLLLAGALAVRYYNAAAPVATAPAGGYTGAIHEDAGREVLTAATPATEINAVHTGTGSRVKHTCHNTAAIQKEPPAQPAPPLYPAVAATQEATDPAPPPVIAVKPMRIVHINDLHPTATLQVIAPVARQAVATNATLPVIHLNDVIREEREEHRILKENRLSIHHLSFMNNGAAPEYNAAGNTPYLHSFQIKLTN